MNAVNNLLRGFFFLLMFAFASCSGGSQNTDRLDGNAVRELVDQKFHGLGELQETVTGLFVAAVENDWSSVYRYRSDDIKRLVDEETFVATMNQKMSDFSLRELEFQLIETKANPSGEISICRVVMRVVQDPHQREHTAVVNWSKESGQWKCDSVGLRGSPLLK